MPARERRCGPISTPLSMAVGRRLMAAAVRISMAAREPTWMAEDGLISTVAHAPIWTAAHELIWMGAVFEAMWMGVSAAM
jgi:hypothetical protein